MLWKYVNSNLILTEGKVAVTKMVQKENMAKRSTMDKKALNFSKGRQIIVHLRTLMCHFVQFGKVIANHAIIGFCQKAPHFSIY